MHRSWPWADPTSPAGSQAASPAAGQEVAAFVLSLGHQGQGGDRAATLLSLGTRQSWRGRGLATAVIGHALTACRQAGFAAARLQVCSHNTGAVSLYTKLGFTNGDRGYALLMGPIREQPNDTMPSWER